MPNMSPKKNEMPTQAPDVRNKNFKEVALGYTPETAIDEAKRCLNCKHKPCVAGCPVKIHIPAFIEKMAQGDFEGAYEIIAQSSSLPAVCGRVCPQETQCEQKCVRGIKGEPVAIGRLERFAADYHNANCKTAAKKPESNGIRLRLSVPARLALPAPEIWQRQAMRLRCLKHCIWPAAFWFTEFRNSVCRRQLCKRKSTP